MDINDLRGVVTAITMLAFIGLWILVWSKHRKADYDESARLPLEEDDHPISENAREKL